MSDDSTIGGHSRRFRLAVLVGLLFVLFTSVLAVGAIDIPGPGAAGPGQSGDGEAAVDGDGSPLNSTQNNSEQPLPEQDGPEQNDSAQDPSEQDDQSESAETDTDDAGETASQGGVSSYGGTSGGGYPEQSTVGGPLELSNQPELRIESPEPSRWRLGGYDRYTGDGWARDGEPEPLSAGGSDSRYEIQVETLRPFRSLATVWRPTSAAVDGEVSVTDQGGFVVGEPLEPNETYTTSTSGPPSRSAARTATGVAPADIQDRYTQLPSTTPNRLTEKTDEITAGADTPYEAAVTVERWLQENKEYSLDAGHDRGNDVATEFVFEMDAGYCQYFATAMTAMLRTQDIPTRYVTGYTPGERVGENTYLVRGKNAHAWVEVYFEGVGWVSFDPTPGGGRADAGRTAADSDGGPDSDEDEPDRDDSSDSDADASEDQSEADDEDQQDAADNETDEDDSSETDEQSEEEIPGPPYEISLSPDPVPGEDVNVTVEKNGTAVAGVEISFNGEVVGTTDGAGQLRATVPYVSDLTVSAGPPAGSTGSVDRLRPAASGFDTERETLFAPRGGAQTSDNSSVRYEIPTEATVETRELAVPGRRVTANMTLNGSSVSGLDVIVDGETVNSTGERGNFTLTVPADSPLDETLPVRFERGEFVAEGTVTVADVDVDIDTGVLKLPGTSADVTVTATDGETELQLEAVPIRATGGDAVAATDDDGTAAMTLPWSNEGTATAVVGEHAVTASVSGILLHLLAVLGVSVGALVGTGVWLRRNVETLQRIKRRAISALVTAGVLLQQIGHRLYTAVVGLRGRLLDLAARIRDYVVRLRGGITLALLRSPGRYLLALATGFVAWILTLPGSIRGLLSRDSAGQTQVRGRGSESTGSADATEQRQAYRRLRQCWRWLVRQVVRRPRSKTAVEVEQRAVETGLPLRPVRRLRRAFQDVEYGFADPDERVDIAEDSVERLREEMEDDQ